MIDNFLSNLFNSAGEYVDDAISSFGSSSLFDDTLRDFKVNYEEVTDEAEIEKISKDLSNFQSGFGLGTDSPESYDAFKDETGIIVKDGKYYKEKPAQAPAAPVEKQGAITGVQQGIPPGPQAPGRRISYRDVSTSPYTTPSYLTNSQVYNQAVGKLIAGLLNQQTRNPSITTLI
tara:strand:+ start:15715 stop:16239 length:525 start_codon:yes stop_codon:yes gene_type:complete